MSAPPEPPEPEPQITFQGDQDDWDKAPPEWKEHVTKAMMHAAGVGPHPGKYKGPHHQIRYDHERDVHEYPTESDLAHERFQETGPAPELPPGGPLPPQEAVDQPGGGKGKKQPSAKPHGQTPVATAEQVVQPEPPQGGF